MAGGPKKGERRGGREPGAPNKITSEVRQALSLVYQGKVEQLSKWIQETADGFDAIHFLSDGTECHYLERNPSKAAELMVRIAEYFVPKLAATQLTGQDGEKLAVTVNISGVREKEQAPNDSEQSSARES
jgi:hypothetical protein